MSQPLLDALRLVSGLLWCAVFVALLGSAVRTAVGHRRPSDWAWAWPWAFAIHQAGYAARWWNSWAHVPDGGNDMASLVGLQVLSALLAISVLCQRYLLEGKRW